MELTHSLKATAKKQPRVTEQLWGRLVDTASRFGFIPPGLNVLQHFPDPRPMRMTLRELEPSLALQAGSAGDREGLTKPFLASLSEVQVSPSAPNSVSEADLAVCVFTNISGEFGTGSGLKTVN